MLEAIGTIMASLIALFSILYFELLRPLLQKPSLEIKFENLSPYSSLTHVILGGKPPGIKTSIARIIRVGIRNNSKFPARGVRVKFKALANKDLRQNRGFISYDLPWVDIEDSRREILAKSEEALVDLFIGVKDDPEAWWLQPYDPIHSRGFGNIAGLPKTPQNPFIAYIELIAYAENLERPVSQVFEIIYDEPKKLKSLNMSKTDKGILMLEFIPIEDVLETLEEYA